MSEIEPKYLLTEQQKGVISFYEDATAQDRIMVKSGKAFPGLAGDLLLRLHGLDTEDSEIKKELGRFVGYQQLSIQIENLPRDAEKIAELLELKPIQKNGHAEVTGAQKIAIFDRVLHACE